MAPAGTRSVLVTGCSSGIGRATAVHLAAQGHTVYATARRREAIADLEPAGCRTLALDVTDDESMRAAVRAVEDEEGGAVGALVNNAGYSLSGAVEEVPMSEIRRQFETNVFGLVRMCQLVLPGMRARRSGRIVNVSSMGANFTLPGGGYYHATKHAVDALSDALRFEVAGFGVDVAIIQPGFIRTRFGQTTAVGIDANLPREGPYADFNAGVAASTKSVYERGVLARLGGGPESVARTIERAITAPRPRTRYRVTPSARVMTALHALLSDRAWDRVMAGEYPRPGA